MKKVLIITYYWPPSGGIAVQRWLQFSKNLPDNGWQPIIFTAKDAQYPIFDEELLKQVPENLEIHRVKVPEPNNITSLFQKGENKSKSIYKLQQQSNVNKSPLKRFMWTIRGNFFIPDARMFWINKSFRYLERYLSKNPVDAVISTGPPHSTHMIAKKIKEQFGTPWISDFRDPWTSMDYLQVMNLKKFAKKKHQQQEEAVLRQSSNVIVVGRTIQKEFQDNYNINSQIIHNGYSSVGETKAPVVTDAKFTITHTGSFSHRRNCDELWIGLSELVKENENLAQDLEIKLVGNVAPIVLESIEKYKLKQFLTLIDHVDHVEAKMIQRSAQLLLLPIDRVENAEFVVTGKVFEYLQAKRPILLIGPDQGDAAEIVRSCAAGSVIPYDDISKLKEVVSKKYEKYRNKDNNCDSTGVDQFSYPVLTKKVVELLEKSIHD